ncbi:hypothetical protein FSP39_021767 [Pinctada imbricata]|uniref:Exonuclease 1 n=1 Tax=Pinctada imbricata TaxID=66713 RepID=A0AA88YEL6_PINIB|nr:hypothetical protein FSP39_021767 [Pinctada imbricata]
MDDIEEKLSLDRSKLVAMALLLGCDYLPKVVPGVGMDKAMKLMKVYTDSGVDALHRFATWKRIDEGRLLNPIER